MKFESRNLLDRITLYLPIVLMGLLALATYWLVRSTPLFQDARAPQVRRQTPDYEMTRFSVKTFDLQGRLTNELYGEKARHYPHRQVLEIDRVRILSHSEAGYDITATARTALAKDDMSEVQLRGDAYVVRDAWTGPDGKELPQMTVRSDNLYAHLRSGRERLEARAPVQIVRGSDYVFADRLEYDHATQVLELQGRVRSELRPSSSRAESGQQ